MLALLGMCIGAAIAQEDEGFYMPDSPTSRVQTFPLYHSYDGVVWEQRGDLTLTIQEERRRRSSASLKTNHFDKARLVTGGLYHISLINEPDKTRIQSAVPVCNLLGSDLLEELTVYIDAESAHVISLSLKGASGSCGSKTAALRPQTSVEIGSTIQALKPLFTVPKPVLDEQQEQTFFGKYWWAILLGVFLIINMSGPAPEGAAASPQS